MSCCVYLDNYRNVYSAGEVIEGRVICNFTSRKEIRGIRVKLRGKEHTSWWKSESYYDSVAKKRKTRRVRYHGDNTFLDQQLSLHGGGNLGPATLEYPFSFALPTTLPDSFKNAHGHVEYYVKANVDIPWAPDYEGRHDLTVKTPIDLNRMPNLCLNPVQYEDEKTVCCCFCASGPITMTVYMDKEAFVVTERPKLKVRIVNMSNVSMESFQVKVVMTIISKTEHPRSDKKYDKELIASSYDTGVGAHGERNYDVALDIPRSTFVPNFNLCRLFEKYIKIIVEGVLPGCHTNMEIKIPIVLGHVPMANSIFVDGCYERVATVSYPPNTNPPPYDGFAQPTGPSGPPSYNPEFGFIVPSSSGPSAPPPENVPSAPTKASVQDDDFEDIDDNRPTSAISGPPPPYIDAIRTDNIPK